MAACANGAQPTPGLTQASVYVQAAAIGADAFEFVGGFWPALLPTTVLAALPLTNLCNLNPDDPGQLSLATLTQDLSGQNGPLPEAPVGTLGRWVYDKALYAAFHANCVCIGTGAPPPTPIVVVPPTNVPPFPTGTDTTPQLDRIENALGTSSTGLDTLYLGLQEVHNQVGDMRYRIVPAIPYYHGAGALTISGEGYMDLGSDIAQPGTGEIDRVGVMLALTSIPSTVAKRGTLHPRLYGVGSLEWDAQAPSVYGNYWTVQRDAIHYQTQFVQAPQHVQTTRLWWRLQPGVSATIVEISRTAGGAVYPTAGAHDVAWTGFHSINPPAGWSDAPFYPKPAAAAAALPAPP